MELLNHSYARTLVTALFLGTIFCRVTNGQNCHFGWGTATTPWPEEPGPTPSEPEPTPLEPEAGPLISEAKKPEFRPHSIEARGSERDTIGYYYVTETQSPDTPFATLEAYNMVWAHAESTDVRIEVGSDNMARFYLTDSFRNSIDYVRDYGLRIDVAVRCTEGSRVDYLEVLIQDENARAPQFSPETSISLSVPESWPSAIPVNLQDPVFVRDLDFTLANARVTLAAFPTGVLRPVISPLFSGEGDGLMYDYKVELYLEPGVPAGRHNVQITASDGVHETQFWVFLNLTEVVCKGQNIEPTFGHVGGPKVLYYNSTVDRVPKKGDALLGVIVQSFNAGDATCTIELSTNDELLTINEGTGQVTFTRDLSIAELENLGRTWIVEIVGKEPDSGKTASVPLVITIDFETIHSNL